MAIRCLGSGFISGKLPLILDSGRIFVVAMVHININIISYMRKLAMYI